MQVSNATIGIITELEIKSRKSRIEVPAPRGSMNERELYPKVTRRPISVVHTITVARALPREQWVAS